jgi:hypothetical protein
MYGWVPSPASLQRRLACDEGREGTVGRSPLPRLSLDRSVQRVLEEHSGIRRKGNQPPTGSGSTGQGRAHLDMAGHGKRDTRR